MTTVQSSGMGISTPGLSSGMGIPTPGLLSPEIELGHLTEAERQAIFAVIRRDEALRQRELETIESIKKDINRMVELEKQLDADDDDWRFDAKKSDTNKLCSRCQKEFGWLFNRGDVCTKCHQKVCDSCRHLVTTKERWLCTLCFKRVELQTWTAAWLQENLRRSRRKKRENGGQTKREDTPHPEQDCQIPMTSRAMENESMLKLDLTSNRIDLNHNGDITPTEESQAGMVGVGGSSEVSSSEVSPGVTSTADDVELREGRGTGGDTSPGPEEVFSEAEPSTENVVHSTNSLRSNVSARSDKALRSQISLGSTESLSSAYSNMGRVSYGKFTALGEIMLSYRYIQSKKQFEVTINQCKDIAPVDTVHNVSNPYVKIYLLPDKSKTGKRKTKIKRKTLSTTYNECFTYNISPDDLKTRTLWVAVWHHEPLTRNEFLADVAIPLSGEQSLSEDGAARWYKLQQEGGGKWKSVLSLVNSGEMLLAVKWLRGDDTERKSASKVKSKGELQVVIRQARGLASVKPGGQSNIFCKCRLLPQRVTHKSLIVRNDLNPTFNHTVTFKGLSSLEELCLEISVWEFSRAKSNDFLGGVRLNNGAGRLGTWKCPWMDSNEVEQAFWRKIISQPEQLIEETIPLRQEMETDL